MFEFILGICGGVIVAAICGLFVIVILPLFQNKPIEKLVPQEWPTNAQKQNIIPIDSYRWTNKENAESIELDPDGKLKIFYHDINGKKTYFVRRPNKDAILMIKK